MHNFTVYINEQGVGVFSVFIKRKKVALMKIQIKDSDLIVHKTTVLAEKNTKRAAKELLNEVVEYARMHTLKVISQSKYVRMQFQKQPFTYADVWEKA